MKKIILAEDAFDPNTWKEYEDIGVVEFLMSKFSIFPDNARIYHKEVAHICDVTPSSESDIDTLNALEGPFIVVLYPGYDGGFSFYMLIVMLVVSIGMSVYTYLSMPNVANKGSQSTAPSNSLSDRQNQARPKSRIPDIYGQVRSTPDLLQVPYKVFENNIEVEYCYMCIGRGTYEIDSSAIYDGETSFSAISGASASVYGPNNIPLHGTPQLQIGNSISQGVLSVSKSNAVNGQTLYSPNYRCIPPGYYTNAKFKGYNETGTFVVNGASIIPGICLSVDYDTDVKIETIFAVGDFVYIAGAATVTDGSHTVNLNGSYTVVALNSTDDIIILLPGSDTITAVTYLKNNFPSGTSNNHNTSYVYVDITGTYGVTIPNGVPPYDRTIGPIYITLRAGNYSQLQLNLVSLQGMYYLDGNNQSKWSNSFLITVQPVTSTGTPIGSPSTTTTTMTGSQTDKSQIGISFYAGGGSYLSADMYVAVYVKNTTLNPYDGKNYVGNPQWRDMYATVQAPQTTFGNITTIQTRIPATPSALGTKERKLNLLCTRKVPVRVSGNTFGALTATKKADAIICAIALDPYIGNRDVSEISVDNIYDTVASIISYFGISESAEFCYTFDDMNITFEETMKMIASSIFCEAYRQGHVTKLFFEKQNDNSMLLFNHRNKIPGSETRSVRFGNADNCDGVELTYVNPVDESESTYYIPIDQSAIKPQTIKTVGVRNDKQAYLLSWRAWNKILHQNISVEFTATQEANALVRNNRILVADNTRPDTQDGEILSQNVLELQLSQLFEYTVLNHTIYLQLYDGTTQAIEIASADVSPARNITLSEPPNLPLSLDYSLSRRTTYVIIKNDDSLGSAFLVDTKTPQDITKCQIVANNYDARYYDNDGDFR